MARGHLDYFVPQPVSSSAEFNLAKRAGALAGSTFEELVNVTGGGTLETLEFSANKDWADVELVLDGHAYYFPFTGGVANYVYVSPYYLSLVGGECALFRITCFDSNKSEYALQLSHPVSFNTSLAIYVRNQGSISINLAAVASYRVLI